MSKISLRYARALLLATGTNIDELKTISSELSTVAKVLNTKSVLDFFANPIINNSEKEKVIEKTFHSAVKNIINFLKLVSLGGNMREIANIAVSFRKIVAETADLVVAQVESPTKLDQKQTDQLSSVLQKMTKKEIIIEQIKNPNLIGGIRVKLGDEVIDLSTAGKLQKLSQAFELM